MRLLCGFGVENCSLCQVIVAYEVHLVFGPESENKLDSFPGLVHSDLRGVPFAVGVEEALCNSSSNPQYAPAA